MEGPRPAPQVRPLEQEADELHDLEGLENIQRGQRHHREGRQGPQPNPRVVRHPAAQRDHGSLQEAELLEADADPNADHPDWAGEEGSDWHSADGERKIGCLPHTLDIVLDHAAETRRPDLQGWAVFPDIGSVQGTRNPNRRRILEAFPGDRPEILCHSGGSERGRAGHAPQEGNRDLDWDPGEDQGLADEEVFGARAVQLDYFG